MKSKRDGFFWVSYTDVMITLFFVMLAIAAISVLQVNVEKQNVIKAKKASEEELRRIKEIQDSVKKLQEITTKDGRRMFDYKNNRFETRPIRFERGAYSIIEMDKPYLKEVGQALNNLVARSNDKASYLIVIEGGADSTGDCREKVFKLSYERAHGLWEFWLSNGINLKQPPKSDLQISGTGDQIPRTCTEPDRLEGQPLQNEADMRRFSIHVLPLIPNVTAIK